MGDFNITFKSASRQAINVGYGQDVIEACGNFNSQKTTIVYILTIEVFSNAVKLYDNSYSNTYAQSGWYSDGSIAREWINGSFTGNQQNCS